MFARPSKTAPKSLQAVAIPGEGRVGGRQTSPCALRTVSRFFCQPARPRVSSACRPPLGPGGASRNVSFSTFTCPRLVLNFHREGWATFFECVIFSTHPPTTRTHTPKLRHPCSDFALATDICIGVFTSATYVFECFYGDPSSPNDLIFWFKFKFNLNDVDDYCKCMSRK